MGYTCFHTYFVVVNAQQKLHVDAHMGNNDENANDDDTEMLSALGTDALWGIAFEAPLDVSKLTTRELLRVYERWLDDVGDSDASVGPSVTDFLHRVFQKLVNMRDSTGDSHSH